MFESYPVEGESSVGKPAYEENLAKFSELSLEQDENVVPMRTKPGKIQEATSTQSPFKTPIARRPTIKSKVLKDVQQGTTARQVRESYFMTLGGNKTSSHTLDMLRVPGDAKTGLPNPETFERLVQKHAQQSSKDNITSKMQRQLAERLFSRWPIYLKEGFNILLYGSGSKRDLLQAFRRQVLPNSNCIEVAGYLPTLNIRSVLTTICNDFLQMSESLTSAMDQLQQICRLLNRKAAAMSPLFLLIHNLDGPGLRHARTQAVISKLAEVEHIHLVASIDHASTPILWSHNELARFNWIWEDCTTLASYREEASYANSTFLQSLLSGLAVDALKTAPEGLGNIGGALASLYHVSASLTQNAREIYRMVAEYQLSESKSDTAPGASSSSAGMPLEDLYWRCRDSFLTTSEATLRAQLTEFRDHKLIKFRKGIDGTELLVIPMDDVSLQKFVKYFNQFCC